MSSLPEQSRSLWVTAMGWIAVAASSVYLAQIGYVIFAVSPVLLLAPVVIMAITLATIGIVVGVGLLKRKNWARIGMISMLVYVLLSSVIQFLFVGTDAETVNPAGPGENGAIVYEPPSTLFLATGVIVCVLGIYLLLRPAVKKEFGVVEATNLPKVD